MIFYFKNMGSSDFMYLDFIFLLYYYECQASDFLCHFSIFIIPILIFQECSISKSFLSAWLNYKAMLFRG